MGSSSKSWGIIPRINTSVYVYHKRFCNHTWETFPCRVRSHLSILLSAREIDILNVDINSLINKGRLSCIDAYSHIFR